MELLIGTTVSMIIMGCGLALMNMSMVNEERIAQVQEMTENARLGLDMMTRDIRMAGHSPCSQIKQVTNVLERGDTWWGRSYYPPLAGSVLKKNGKWKPNFWGKSNTALKNAVKGSDALNTLMALDTNCPGYLVNSFDSDDSGNAKIELYNDRAVQGKPFVNDVKNGELLFITDCKHTSIFAGKSSGGAIIELASGNAEIDLDVEEDEEPKEDVTGAKSQSYNFPAGSRLMKFFNVTYYVARVKDQSTDIPNDDATGKDFALVRVANTTSDGHGVSDENMLYEIIALGVRKMRLEYGFAPDGQEALLEDNKLVYVPANKLAKKQSKDEKKMSKMERVRKHLKDIVSVRINLLVRSKKQPNKPAEPVLFFGQEERPKKGYQYRVISETVYPRNL